MTQPAETIDSAPPAVGAGWTTLIDGSTFCISRGSGEIVSTSVMGLFVRDTRVISTWQLQVQGGQLEPLVGKVNETFEGTFVSHGSPSLGDAASSLLVVERRDVGEGMHCDISVTNSNQRQVDVTLQLEVAADFADIFAVKREDPHPGARTRATANHNELLFELLPNDGEIERAVRISAKDGDPDARPGCLTWTFSLSPHEERSFCVEVVPEIDGIELSPTHSCSEHHETSDRTAALLDWRQDRLRVQSPNTSLVRLLNQSLEDLASLRFTDPRHPSRTLLAARRPMVHGAVWPRFAAHDVDDAAVQPATGHGHPEGTGPGPGGSD